MPERLFKLGYPSRQVYFRSRQACLTVSGSSNTSAATAAAGHATTIAAPTAGNAPATTVGRGEYDSATAEHWHARYARSATDTNTGQYLAATTDRSSAGDGQRQTVAAANAGAGQGSWTGDAAGAGGCWDGGDEQQQRRIASGILCRRDDCGTAEPIADAGE